MDIKLILHRWVYTFIFSISSAFIDAVFFGPVLYHIFNAAFYVIQCNICNSYITKNNRTREEYKLCIQICTLRSVIVALLFHGIDFTVAVAFSIDAILSIIVSFYYYNRRINKQTSDNSSQAE